MKKIYTNILLALLSALLLLSCQQSNSNSNSNSNSDEDINTVSGSINSSDLGITLTHEHVMSNFGKEIDETSSYDTTKLFNQVIPYLKKLDSLGLNSIVDCTTEYFGRRIDLLEKISAETGIQIITNTGFYGAANDRYIPEFAFDASPGDIADIWIDEFNNGINGTGIKPGFIKLAFDDNEPPSAIDKKLFEAGILTHLNTGLTIAVHTGKNIDAVKFQQSLLNKFNVQPNAWIWTHANKMEEDNDLIDLAAKGAWISLDGVKESNIDQYVSRLKLFKKKNLLNRVLISHDGNGFPGGGEIRGFSAIFEVLIPTLLDHGFSESDINQLIVLNPKEAFSIGIRKK